MFNIGGGELLVILLVALIVLGPNRLPGAARQVGQFVGELRRLSSGFQAELRDALDEPFDTTDFDTGRARRRAPSRQAQLRPTSGTAVERQRRPPVEPDAATGDETAAGTATGTGTGSEAIAPPAEAPATASSAERAAEAAHADAAEPAEDAGAADAAGAAEADPTASSGPVTAAPAAPDPDQPATRDATEDGDRAAG